MTLLQLKKLIANITKIRLVNLLKSFFVKGHRSEESVFLPISAVYLRISSNAQISINKGDFLLNSFFSRPEPIHGVLKLFSHSRIEVEDNFIIHSGCDIRLQKGAVLRLGSGYINNKVTIRCFKEINIGKNVAISENVTIWDTDAHIMVGKEHEMTKPVNIGNHVWIGNNVTILKGVTIGDGAVIAAGAVVNKDIPSSCLAGGVPAKVLKENIKWK